MLLLSAGVSKSLNSQEPDFWGHAHRCAGELGSTLVFWCLEQEPIAALGPRLGHKPMPGINCMSHFPLPALCMSLSSPAAAEACSWGCPRNRSTVGGVKAKPPLGRGSASMMHRLLVAIPASHLDHGSQAPSLLVWVLKHVRSLRLASNHRAGGDPHSSRLPCP